MKLPRVITGFLSVVVVILFSFLIYHEPQPKEGQESKKSKFYRELAEETLNNWEIIEDSKLCEDNGMDAHVIEEYMRTEWNSSISYRDMPIEVRCYPKTQREEAPSISTGKKSNATQVNLTIQE